MIQETHLESFQYYFNFIVFRSKSEVEINRAKQKLVPRQKQVALSYSQDAI